MTSGTSLAYHRDVARLRLPYPNHIQAARRLIDRFGPRWFTVKDATPVLREDGVERLIMDPRYTSNVRRSLLSMAKREVLASMYHPLPSGPKGWWFKVTDDGHRLVKLYEVHDSLQRDLGDVLDVL